MCTKPLKAFRYGKTKNGKDNYIITSYKCHHVEITPQDKILKIYEKGTNYNNIPIHDFIEIPCGKCLECKLEYSRMWADRCMLEAKQYKDNCFITLTYDEDNVPVNDLNYKTLKKDDLQNFLKALRNHVNYKDGKYLKKEDRDYKIIRYYACGEYGEKKKRPHYHAILFNFIPDDLLEVGVNINGQKYYRSDFLEKIWNKGNVIVGNADWNSCAYVSRYVAKKQGVTNNNIYELTKIQEEFVLMSKKPGIGFKWYEDHNVCYANFTKNYISTINGSKTITHNKYFDKLLDRDDPNKLEEVKSIRKEFAEERKKIKLSQTSLPYLELLQVTENNLKQKTKSLVRKENF